MSGPKIGDEPCGSCGARMFDCFTGHMTTGKHCCPDCDKHGYKITDRGQAVVDALDDGLTYDDAIVLHGKSGPS